jgi:integrase
MPSLAEKDAYTRGRAGRPGSHLLREQEEAAGGREGGHRLDLRIPHRDPAGGGREAEDAGARAGEIFSLEWVDIDFENRTVRITPEKGSEPRIFKISNKFFGMLEGIPRGGEKIFCHYKLSNNLRRTFERYRRRIAYNLGNPRLLRITFHTLRHWKATTEYHKTKDILYVMQLLGHKNIKNTLIYTADSIKKRRRVRLQSCEKRRPSQQTHRGRI